MFPKVNSYRKSRYDFEVENKLGSVQGTITLIVQEENSRMKKEIGPITEITKSLENKSVPQERFGEYVAQLHESNNQGFEAQYKVYYVHW